MRFQDLNAFSPKPSVFPAQVKRLFDRVKMGDHDAAFDYYCRGCSQPVRRLFWEQERGMGGPWDSYVKMLLELDDAPA